MTLDIDRSMRWAAIVIFAYTMGVFTSVKFYQLQGLWGSQNQLKHVERVVLPTVAKAAVAASHACQRNISAAWDNGASPEEVNGCPKPPPIALSVASK